MNKLGIIAITGLAISAISMGVAATIGAQGGGSMNWSWFDDLGDCKVNHATATSRSFDWKGDDEVDVTVPVNLHYKPGQGTQVQVSGDPELVSHVTVDDGDIKLDCGRHNWHHQRLDVTLPGNRTFREIDLKGAGSIDLAEINQPELEIGLAGKSEVHAKDLIAQKVEINIAGHGEIETSPVDSVDISIAGHGKVKLYSEPKHVNTSILGHGEVEHLAPKG
ncbi:MAG TPA: DUF2807 domain-containing protein [Rhizomicrobium sp.]|nr:DUF2807 domain-containing protein [Rhizomicrobium sp.]